MTSTQNNTDSRNSNSKKNTPLIPVCKYAKSTPWDQNHDLNKKIGLYFLLITVKPAGH